LRRAEIPVAKMRFAGGFVSQKASPKVADVLERLEKHYGPQKAVGPSDPYEMIVFANCGYPATDVSCMKGYGPLKAEVGTKPDEILKAPSAKLAKLTKDGGMLPELRAERLKLIARIANGNFGGNLKWALETLMKDEKTPPDKRLRRVKGALKEFPVIGEPGADKILLFSGMLPIAAVPSAFPGVPQRIFFGHEDKNYGKGYRAAQEVLETELPEKFEARQRAYLLLKKHGQEICKRTKPKCEICPINAVCVYFQEGRGKAS
jgi:endonuclease III